MSLQTHVYIYFYDFDTVYNQINVLLLCFRLFWRVWIDIWVRNVWKWFLRCSKGVWKR